MSFFSSSELHLSSHPRPPTLRQRAGLSTALLTLTLAVGCTRPPAVSVGSPTPSAPPAQPAQPAANPTSFALRGEIVGVVTDKRVLLVHHEEIPNYMPAMTMEFKIGEADISVFKEGQRITATMVDEKNGDFRLEGIRLLDPVKDSIVSAAARDLKEDTFVRGKAVYREIGEVVPRFALFDQDGNVFRIDHLRGRRVILNFIFTRCPIATMCPAATARMIALQRRALEQKVPDLHLVSISLDPTYDTPPVLKGYAAARGIDTRTFSFLTGPESAVRDLLTQFGVIAEKSDNLWKHTLATLLIDRDGKIAHRVDGSTWEPDEFLRRL
ncbi:MAG: SCO family protein [Opitutaceae bacterium]|nr:SCO family protein [Opitutaceae bacterium]